MPSSPRSLTLSFILGLALLALLLPVAVSAQELIVVVRHAERADSSADSLLSATGEARATHLAAMLKDSGITQIYTTDLRRTIQTAAPLASLLKQTPTALPAADVDGLLVRVHQVSAADRLLIVGHSNTLPDILKRLGVATPITIADMEYDNLFVVIPHAGAPASLMRLRF